MKSFVQAFFAFGLMFVAWMALPGAAHADTAPDCMQSDTRHMADGKLQEWWDKRTPEQQKYIRELPCKERYIPMVCIFLFEPRQRLLPSQGSRPDVAGIRRLQGRVQENLQDALLLRACETEAVV